MHMLIYVLVRIYTCIYMYAYINMLYSYIHILMHTYTHAGNSLDLIEAISKKTIEIITQLKSLANDGSPLDEETLTHKVANESSRNWLIRLSYSEGLI